MTEGLAFLARARAVLDSIDRQAGTITRASEWMADAVHGGGLVHVFGSGHSVIPVLDVFPRYGSFPAFHPLIDPRLVWQQVVGGGGAPELLWLERAPGYIENFLRDQALSPGDVFLVFSHGGMNAAPVEAAAYARTHGLRVVAVTSRQNLEAARARGDRRPHLSDAADLTIDNGVPPEDALVAVDGVREPLGAGSTVAVTAIVGALVSELGRSLARRGAKVSAFVSPNVPGIAPGHNRAVFDAYRRVLAGAQSRALAPAAADGPTATT